MSDSPLRLNIGGTTPLDDWKILNVQAGLALDFVGDCTDLDRIRYGRQLISLNVEATK